ncbi:MAG: efflux RND transporter periplasmic adaptor subunit [Opitutaceae bacterium]
MVLFAGSFATQAARAADAAPKASDAKQLYQCSMHPNIVSEKPGACPICGMDLQPVKKIDAPGIAGRSPVELTAQQQQLINIRVAPVVRDHVAQEIRAVGIITYDTSRMTDVNARVMGWVEKLYVDKPGQAVRAGEPLMALYSPDLYSAQREYLLAWRSAQRDRPAAGEARSESLNRYLAASDESVRALLESARQRLRLWGISDDQIEQLQQTGKPSETMELLAPGAGVVIEKKVLPQQMVQPGMTLYQLADLSQVWLEVEVFEYELPLIKEGQEVAVTVAAYPDETFSGTVDFIYPYLQDRTRTTKVRVVLPNPDGRLRPDMYATAVGRVDLGDRLLVPASAVFDTGRRQYVFVKQGEGLFVPKQIKLGAKVGDRFVVSSGIAVGEQVVVDGSFLLDSESQLKAAASGSGEMEMNAVDAGHEHAGAAPAILQPLPEAARPAVSALIDACSVVHDALARDTLDGVGDAFARLRTATEELVAVADAMDANGEQFRASLDALARCFAAPPTNDIKAARVQFGAVSKALIDLFEAFPPPLPQPINIAFCPMWKDSPARWLQRGTVIENPFMGQAMAGCGEITGTIETR